MLKQYKIKFSNLIKDEELRNDQKYHYFLHYSNWNLFNSKNKNLISLKYILEGDFNLFKYKEWEEYKWLPTWQGYLDEDWKIKDFQIVTLEEHPWRLKYKVSNENILISSLKLAKSSAMLFENIDLSKYVFSNGFYIFKVKNNWNIKFVLYILKNKKLKDILDNNIYRWIWISAYRKQDLLKIKIPNLSLPTQNEIVTKIEPIEQKIKEQKSQIKEQKEVINLVFARVFGFNENLVNEFGKWMTALTQSLNNRKLKTFNINLNELIKSENYRISTRFHNIPTKKMMNILDWMKTVRIKNILSENIHRWASPKYDDFWNIPVVKTGHLKNWYIEISKDEFVNEDFYKSSERSNIRKNDILIASTWKGSLWKIDLVETNKNLVCDGHITIVRIDKNKYNVLFLTYFLRSILWIFQVERDYTGATNQVELYSNEIWNFKIPDINKDYQQKIVDEIKKELDKQEKIKGNIEIERKKIDKLIEESIRDF